LLKLSKLTDLQRLDLGYGEEVTEKGLARLREALPGCQIWCTLGSNSANP
jgi:hypothetical protein